MSAGARGPNYQAEEDKALCKGWLQASEDSAIGLNQNGEEFYTKVKGFFEEILQAKDRFVVVRNLTSLSSRFQTISHAVSKFIGCHGKVLALEASGSTPSDIEHQAVELFESDSKNGKFKFLQCWCILRDSPKWGAWRSANNKKRTPSKRRRQSAGIADDVETTTGENELDSSSSSNITSVIPSSGMPEPSNDQRTPGQKRAKLEQANMILYARQVKATEKIAKNGEARNRVAREQVDFNIFTLQPNTDDADSVEFVALQRKLILARLRSKVAQLDRTPATAQETPAPASHNNSDGYDNNNNPARSSNVTNDSASTNLPNIAQDSGVSSSNLTTSNTGTIDNSVDGIVSVDQSCNSVMHTF